MQVYAFTTGPLENNTYVLVDETSGEAAVIDPGLECEQVVAFVQQGKYRLVWIINTHGHFDHVAGNIVFKNQFGAPVAMHSSDIPLLKLAHRQAANFGIDVPEQANPDRLLEDIDELIIGYIKVASRRTPGHSPGGIILEVPGIVFTGDTLFAGSIGRTDLLYGDYDELMGSIRKTLLPLPEDTRIYPGHGPSTDIKTERQHNPFLRDLLVGEN